jgi:hypothetical protein
MEGAIVKDWKAIAAANGLDLKGPELDRLVQTLAALDAAFRPLTADLSPEIEPATVFEAGENGA